MINYPYPLPKYTLKNKKTIGFINFFNLVFVFLFFQDEVLTISEKIVVRVHDLASWLLPNLEWSCGREVVQPQTTSPPPPPTINNLTSTDDCNVKKLNGTTQILTDPGIDFSDVDKQQKEYENNINTTIKQNDNETIGLQSKVIVLSYPRYCRYRALLRRLEGRESSWLCTSVAAAHGGFTALPGTRILFCRDTFDYPDLETHELLCNHLGKRAIII